MVNQLLVCTDLSQSEFESITGVDAKNYFGWDIIKNKSSGQYRVFTHDKICGRRV